MAARLRPRARCGQRLDLGASIGIVAGLLQDAETLMRQADADTYRVHTALGERQSRGRDARQQAGRAVQFPRRMARDRLCT